MNDTNIPIEADAAVESYLSLASLRAAHSTLLKRHREAGDTPELMAEAETFIRRGRATGAWLDVEDERWAGQGLLDYWSTLTYRAGHESPDATLAEFDPLGAPEVDVCPYLGLDAFREAHHDVFFGRQRLIGDMVRQLQTKRLLSVIGPSGSGKSSLVLAGLLPALKRGALPGSRDWRYTEPMVPGSNPLANLIRVLRPPNANADDWDQVQSKWFQKSPKCLSQVIDKLYRGAPTVLVVDQFEELFTLCLDDDVRRAFIDNLMGLIQAPDNEPAVSPVERPAVSPVERHTVIITMRVDFEPYVARLPDFQPLFESAQVRVTPLSAGELREAIEQPAELVGLKFEEGVVDALLQDILGEPAALPLLQFTLFKLWEKRERNRVTWDAYRRLGGGRQALASSADEFYEGLIPEEQVTARRMLLRMVRPGEGLEVTSNRVRRETLYQAGEARDRVERVLDRLIRARLVRLTEGDTPADAQVEVAHEALVRNWPRLVGWLEDERDAMRQRLRLTAAAEQWGGLGRDPEALLRGALLSEALRYQDLNELETEFVQASQQAAQEAEREKEAVRQRELEQARALAKEQQLRAEEQARAARRLRQRAIVLRALIVVLAGAVVLVLIKRQEAQEAKNDALVQLDIATSRQLALQAINHLGFDSQLGLLLAIEAVNVQHTLAANDALRQVLEALAVQPTMYTQGPVSSVALDPNARLLAAGSKDGSIYLWDVSTALSADDAQAVVLRGYAGSVNDVAFSPDGSLLAAADQGGTVSLWNVSSALSAEAGSARPTVLGEPLSPMLGVAFSVDGMLAASGKDGITRLWEVSTALTTGVSDVEVAVLQGFDSPVWGVAFSPDGSSLATYSDDGTVRLWDVLSIETGSATRKTTWTQETPFHSRVAFSPDGSLLAIGGGDGAVRLWEVALAWDEHPRCVVLHGHAGPVTNAAFSPDGSLLATSGEDDTTRLWDVSIAQDGDYESAEIAVLHSHAGSVVDVVFDADGARLFSGGSDETVRWWTVDVEDLMALACECAERNLSQPEWDTFFGHDTPYRQTCSDLPVHSSVGLEYARQGDVDQALDILRQAAEFDPELDPGAEVARVLIEQGRELVYQGEMDEALEVLRQAVELDPTKSTRVAQVLVEQGREFARQGAVDEALDALRQAAEFDPTLELDPEVEVAQMLREQGQELAHQGAVDEALKVLRQALEIDPTLDVDPGAEIALSLVERGQNYAREGRDDEALAAFRQALEIDPALGLVPEAEAARARGERLAFEGSKKEALAELQRALELDPNLALVPEAEVAIVHGLALARENQVDEALDALRQAVELDPDQGLIPEARVADVLAEQAQIWVYEEQGYVKALRALRRAAELYPQVELDRGPGLAWTFYEICRLGSLDGQAGLVLPACGRAVELQPEHGKYYDGRGLARALTGDYAGAIEDFEFYLEWGQDQEPEDYLSKRWGWIEQLEAGENPFDQQTLNDLRGE